MINNKTQTHTHIYKLLLHYNKYRLKNNWHNFLGTYVPMGIKYKKKKSSTMPPVLHHHEFLAHHSSWVSMSSILNGNKRIKKVTVQTLGRISKQHPYTWTFWCYIWYNIIKKTNSKRSTEIWFESGHANCTVKSWLAQSCTRILKKKGLRINLIVNWSSLLFRLE